MNIIDRSVLDQLDTGKEKNVKSECGLMTRMDRIDVSKIRIDGVSLGVKERMSLRKKGERERERIFNLGRYAHTIFKNGRDPKQRKKAITGIITRSPFSTNGKFMHSCS